MHFMIGQELSLSGNGSGCESYNVRAERCTPLQRRKCFRNVSKCVLETITALERKLIQRRHMITSALCQ